MSAHINVRDALYEAPGPKTKRAMYIGTALSLALVLLGLFAIIRQFYITGQLNSSQWSFFLRISTWNFLFAGMRGTFLVAICAGALSLILAFIMMLGRISKHRILRGISRVAIDFFRGVPSLLLVYFFFLVLPKYELRVGVFWMLCLPITLTASGVLAEVLRSGVQAVPKGQIEAAMSIGLTHGQVLRKIILPQAIRYVIPSLIAQFVIVVKDTTVAYVVSYPDLMQNARVLVTTYDALVSVYFVTAVIYILINYLINRASKALSRRMGLHS